MSAKPLSNPYQGITLVHTALFDQIMPTLSGDAWKVLCVAFRHTWGEGTMPETAQFTADDLRRYAGIATDAALNAAIAECVTKQYILTHKGSIPRYMLNLTYDFATPQPAATPAPATDVAAPPPSPTLTPAQQESLHQLSDFARAMHAPDDPTAFERAVRLNPAETVRAWVEAGQAMTHLPSTERFATALQRLLDQVPPLPSTFFADEFAEDTPDSPPPVAARPAAPPAAVAPTPEAEDDPKTAAGLWQITLKTLKPQMRSNKFTYLKPTRGIELTADTLTVAVPNNLTKDWLEGGQLTDIIQATFKQISGGINLVFVIQE